MTFLKQLDEGVRQAAGHVEQLGKLLLVEMNGLAELVGSRSSVPKEQAR